MAIHSIYKHLLRICIFKNENIVLAKTDVTISNATVSQARSISNNKFSAYKKDTKQYKASVLMLLINLITKSRLKYALKNDNLKILSSNKPQITATTTIAI